jgi:Zn-dependent M28 family amino/carboxypeptidase
MTKFRWLAATAIAAAAAPLAAQSVPSFDASRMSRHVQTLGSDAFEGRGPATRGETKTVDYIVSQFNAAGLKPGGDLVNGRRSWTQAVPLLQSDIVGTPQISLNLNGTAVPLRQGEDVALTAPLNGSTNITLANAPLLFAGYGVTAPERQWDDFKGQDVKGKIIVVLINDPDIEGGEGQFGGKAMTYYGRWTYKLEEAARRGAAGVMIVHETVPASYGWNTVKNSWTGSQFDIVRRNPAEAHSPFESWIQLPLAQRIFQASGLSFEQAKAAAKRRDFRPIELKAALTANITATTKTITSYNVAGMVPGKRYPDETMIYTAHHDHLGIGKPDANGDTIFNGATDNATGIAHLIEQGRVFARGPRPDRSILFLAVAAEEQGLLGSKYYVANPLYPLARTVGVINTDSMGTNGRSRDFTISGQARLELLDRLIAAAQARGRAYTPDPNTGAGYFFRSDHFPFAQKGVPAISFGSGTDLVNGGKARGDAIAAEYRAKRYHQQDDEFQPSWDFSGMVDDAQLLHIVGRDLANSRDWPNWSSDSEFRAARDAGDAERNAPGAPPPRKGERG